jgi:hypothetical protein
MDENVLEIPGSELVGLLPNDSQLLCLLSGAFIVHESRGRGTILRVELRGTYTPLVHIKFDARDAIIPLDVFSNGRFTVILSAHILQSLRTERDSISAVMLEAERRAEVLRKTRDEALRQKEELDRLIFEKACAEFQHEGDEASRILRETLPARHRERIEKLGLEYKGIRAVTRLRNRRITHCWACHDHLDNTVDVECVLCGWILCTCGACGCGYDRTAV